MGLCLWAPLTANRLHTKNQYDLWLSIATGALDGESPLDRILIRFGNSFYRRKGGSSVQIRGLRSDICGSPLGTPQLPGYVFFWPVTVSLIPHLCQTLRPCVTPSKRQPGCSLRARNTGVRGFKPGFKSQLRNLLAWVSDHSTLFKLPELQFSHLKTFLLGWLYYQITCLCLAHSNNFT